MNLTHNYNSFTLTKEDVSGIVVSVAYVITTTDTDTGLFNSHRFHTGLPKPSSEDYIPFEELTKEQVVEWLQRLNGDRDELQAVAEFTAYVERVTMPVQITTTAPWEE